MGWGGVGLVVSFDLARRVVRCAFCDFVECWEEKRRNEEDGRGGDKERAATASTRVFLFFSFSFLFCFLLYTFPFFLFCVALHTSGEKKAHMGVLFLFLFAFESWMSRFRTVARPEDECRAISFLV